MGGARSCGAMAVEEKVTLAADSVVFLIAPRMDCDSIVETTFQYVFGGVLDARFNSPSKIFLLMRERFPLFD